MSHSLFCNRKRKHDRPEEVSSQVGEQKQLILLPDALWSPIIYTPVNTDCFIDHPVSATSRVRTMCEAVCSCQGSVIIHLLDTYRCKYKSNHCSAGPGGFPGGFPGGAGAGPGMAGLGELLKDPELLNAMKVTNSVLHTTSQLSHG